MSFVPPQLFELIIDTPTPDILSLFINAGIEVHQSTEYRNVYFVDATKGQQVEDLLKNGNIKFRWAITHEEESIG